MKGDVDVDCAQDEPCCQDDQDEIPQFHVEIEVEDSKEGHRHYCRRYEHIVEGIELVDGRCGFGLFCCERLRSFCKVLDAIGKIVVCAVDEDILIERGGCGSAKY